MWQEMRIDQISNPVGHHILPANIWTGIGQLLVSTDQQLSDGNIMTYQDTWHTRIHPLLWQVVSSIIPWISESIIRKIACHREWGGGGADHSSCYSFRRYKTQRCWLVDVNGSIYKEQKLSICWSCVIEEYNQVISVNKNVVPTHYKEPAYWT